ncbi:uncharacterized protein LOC131882501 [Tigriopus californicus]|uniref:uncharacterized protein LOC131882501 n=1 Tax=Tigriopus californicus TaxID=6832 RepID=UPI0027DA5D29|nr:uncharacterized protein LOC131882501 [Tigriopus californicus]
MRSAWRKGNGLSSAELVYGTTLRIPGECLDAIPRDAVADLPFVEQLRLQLRHVVPPPFDYHGEAPVCVPRSLEAAEFVYVRHDARRGPLQPLYDGPFEVLERHAKHFVLKQAELPVLVSINHLKAGHGASPSSVAAPRRRGRPKNVPLAPSEPQSAAPVLADPRDQNLGACTNPTPAESLTPNRPFTPSVKTRSGRVSKKPKRYT